MLISVLIPLNLKTCHSFKRPDKNDLNEKGFVFGNYSAFILTQKQNGKLERVKIVFNANKLWQQKSFVLKKINFKLFKTY